MVYQDLPLWETPIHSSKTQGDRAPYMEHYRVESRANDRIRPAVLICPGGGYGKISDRMAEILALQFCAVGMHAFILHYSIAPLHYTHPLLDLTRAISILRENGAAWNLDTDRIAVFGESAGGHLAASLGVFWHTPWLNEVTKIEADILRPNALVLTYPVISSGPFRHDDSFRTLLGTDYSEPLLAQMSLENRVDANTPPTFVWHTSEDELVPVENALVFSMALRKHRVPFELHVFEQGLHGMALCNRESARNPNENNAETGRWVALSIAWLCRQFDFEP